MQKNLLPFLLNPPGRLIARGELLDALEAAIRRHQANGEGFAVILFAIDRFKLINARFGPTRADEVLRRVGNVARQALSRRGLIGRWSGDEFLCLLPQADADRASEVAEQLRQRIASMVIPVDCSVATTTCSFGVATCPGQGTTAQSLLVAADDALHSARRGGRNRVAQAGGLDVSRLRIGGLLETAIRENRLMPAYQPIVDLGSGSVVAEEALARLITTDEQVLAAHEFIEVASQLQLTHKIDRLIFSAVLRHCAGEAAHDRPRTIFVNVSATLLRHPEVIRELLADARFHGDPRGNGTHPLVLEITERELLEEPRSAGRLLSPFVELGLKLALDDFGSGYSSFQYLADLPIAYLKVDGRLIQRLHEPRVRAIVRGIHSTATDLGLITLAEYVETERQANVLREIGVHWAQGHYFSRPRIDQQEATTRRRLSVNWAQGYYYRPPGSP